jgi:hypothetical protein
VGVGESDSVAHVVSLCIISPGMGSFTGSHCTGRSPP